MNAEADAINASDTSGEALPFEASDDARIARWTWRPAGEAKAIVHIAHGMGEHALRYGRLAEALTAAGYVVYANDHRGHGQTAPPGQFGWLGEDGWNRLLTDLREMIRSERKRDPNLPVILLGHSMGAMATQNYLCRYGSTIDAAVLSGSPGFGAVLPGLKNLLLALFERWRLGPDSESERLQLALFGNANSRFDAPDATGFEWLSRDKSEVQKYIDDPACGSVLTCGSLVDLFNGAKLAAKAERIQAIPKSLPVLAISGSDDPVHSNEHNLIRLLASYRDHLDQVDYQLYPGGRHELFNETNRDEVTADLIGWLDQLVGKG